MLVYFSILLLYIYINSLSHTEARSLDEQNCPVLRLSKNNKGCKFWLVLEGKG